MAESRVKPELRVVEFYRSLIEIRYVSSTQSSFIIQKTSCHNEISVKCGYCTGTYVCYAANCNKNIQPTVGDSPQGSETARFLQEIGLQSFHFSKIYKEHA